MISQHFRSSPANGRGARAGGPMQQLARGITQMGAIVLLTLLLPSNLLSDPIIVMINDVPNARPVITVIGAPNGYDIYTGEEVADPAIEDGALITLIGVNNWFQEPDAYLEDWEGRFVAAAHQE